MGVKIPDQLDYEVTENATFDMVGISYGYSIIRSIIL